MAKKTVPKNNIEPIILDVRKPNFNYDRIKKSGRLDLARVPRSAPGRFKTLKKVILGVLSAGIVAVVAMIIVVAINLKTIKATVAKTGGEIVDNFTSSATALKEFEPGTAVDLLKQNDRSLAGISNLVDGGAGQSFLQFIGNFVPAVKNAFGFMGQITNLNVVFLELANDMQELETNGFKYFQTDGPSLISLLEKIHGLIEKATSQTQEIKNSTSELKNLSSFFEKIDNGVSDQYLKYASELYNWDNILVGLTDLLSPPNERHILVFFQNPSEIRPGGGFIGSYADVTASGGQMEKIDVRDIYDPDGQLDLKVVPPEQLQTLTTDWGARDANWFFDFPTSAKNIVNLMEISKMYAEKNVTFEGAIAMNINVVKTILDVTGPIELADYKLTIDKDNLLNEIQRSVEAGADKKAGEPKKILKVLAPILLKKLESLSSAEQKKLIGGIKEHVAKKDIMFYAKDRDLAGFLATNGLDGSVYGLPNGFWGSYLAVVNANVAGGKSDAFVEEKVAVNLDVDTSGNIFTNLTVTRTHNGNLEKDPWWKATNKNFIRILTEPGSNLVSVAGNDAKPKYQTMNYENSGYAVNPDVAELEKNEVLVSGYKTWVSQEAGKNSFATWLMLKAGETKNLDVRYQTPYNNPAPFGPDKTYAFIFERQAGVKNSLDVTVNAPFKYYWAETGKSVFSYHSDDPDKRVVLTLTLKKQQPDE
jgi:hypothetical protein